MEICIPIFLIYLISFIIIINIPLVYLVSSSSVTYFFQTAYPLHHSFLSLSPTVGNHNTFFSSHLSNFFHCNSYLLPPHLSILCNSTVAYFSSLSLSGNQNNYLFSYIFFYPATAQLGTLLFGIYKSVAKYIPSGTTFSSALHFQHRVLCLIFQLSFFFLFF